MATVGGSSLDREEISRALVRNLSVWEMKKLVNRRVQYRLIYDENSNYNGNNMFTANFRTLKYNKHDCSTAELLFPVTIYDKTYTSFLSNGTPQINTAGAGLALADISLISFASDVFALFQRVVDIGVDTNSQTSFVFEDQINVWKADRMIQQMTAESMNQLAECGIFLTTNANPALDAATAQRLAFLASLNPVYDPINKCAYIVVPLKMRNLNNFRKALGVRRFGFQLDITTTQGMGRNAFWFPAGVPTHNSVQVQLAWKLGIPNQQTLAYRYREIAPSYSTAGLIDRHAGDAFAYESMVISSNPVPVTTTGQVTKLIVANVALPQCVSILGFPTGGMTSGLVNFPGNAYTTGTYTNIEPFVNNDQVSEQPSITLEQQYQDYLETSAYYPTATVAQARPETSWLASPVFNTSTANLGFSGDVFGEKKVEAQYTKTTSVGTDDFIYTYYIRAAKFNQQAEREENGKSWRHWDINTDLKVLDWGKREPDYLDPEMDWSRRASKTRMG